MAKGFTLDKTEKQIILLLQQDGRMSFVDMAEKIGVTEGTIRRKFYRLIDEGVIHIAAVANPFEIGFETPVIIGLNVESSQIKNVLNQVIDLDRVKRVALTTGMFDIIIECYFSSNREMADFVVHELSRIEGITDTNTSVVLEIQKQSYEWGVALGGE